MTERGGSSAVDDAALDELISLLSVANHPIPALALWEVESLWSPTPRDILTRAEQAGLIVIDDDQLITLHPDAAPLELGAMRRSQLRAVLGRVLFNRMSVGVHDLVGHRLAGLLAEPDEGVIPQVLDWAEGALHHGDAQSAIKMYRQVLSALDRGASPASMRVSVLSGLASALQRSGQSAEAMSVRSAAIEFASWSDDPFQRATAALIGVGEELAVNDETGNTAMIDRAIADMERVGPTGDVLRARLLTMRAHRHVLIDVRVAQQASLDALTLARQIDDAPSIVAAAHARWTTRWHPKRLDEALALADEMDRASAFALHTPEYGAMTHLLVLLELGDFQRFDLELRAFQVRAAARRSSVELEWSEMFAASRALVRGEWDGMRRHIESAQQHAGHFVLSIQGLLQTGMTMISAWSRGKDLAGVDFGAFMPGDPTRSAWTGALLGCQTFSLPRDVLAQRVDACLEQGVEGLSEDLAWGMGVAGLAMAVVTLRDHDHAAALIEAIEPIGNQWAFGGGCLNFGPFAFHLGCLHAVLGDDVRARAYLDQALASAQLGGSQPWIARTLLIRAHLTSGDAGVIDLQRSKSVASELGMTRVVAAADRWLAHRSKSRFAGLTEREVQMLGLLVEGQSNKSIAEHMFLSVKSVERILLGVYSKLGVKNRAEASAQALRAGITT